MFVGVPDCVFEETRDRDPVAEAVPDFVDEREPVEVRVTRWDLVSLTE